MARGSATIPGVDVSQSPHPNIPPSSNHGNSLPPFGDLDLKPKLIDDPLDHEIDQLADFGGLVIEAGRRGEDDRPCFGYRGEIAQVDQRQRGFPGHQDQLAALLEADVGGAFDQRAAVAVGDAGDCRHRAGTDDHPRRTRRAGGRTGAAIVIGKDRDGGPVAAGGGLECGDIADARLMVEEPPAVGGHDQPERHLVAGEYFEKPDPVRRARGAADRERDREVGHRPRRLGVGERTGCFGWGTGNGERGTGIPCPGSRAGRLGEGIGPRSTATKGSPLGFTVPRSRFFISTCRARQTRTLSRSSPRSS